ncbi:hypothetical protein HJC23_013938 [Cyclotella cryptica]|uniref:Uncharacterized protein n=1 Tax=Cyclotella cryptica TaxID=29204 RepID=A0ABD3NSS7_9STRA|eukprot:CCRYP_020487-RA/>CCRYP_020487-RA protein AED:0.02 eAED:-0.01 QI:0/-1/0/1/-1/1/1/0/609
MTTSKRMISHLAAFLLSSIAPIAHASCGSEAEVLFQSNAYADSLIEDLGFQGGSVISSQSDWERFLFSFRPNSSGDRIARTSIDFDKEKVVLATYATRATCLVEIDDAWLECESSSDSSTLSLKMFMDVYDSSYGCNIACMALGQVVYAVAVPLQWEVDTSNGFVIDVTGPCAEAASTSSTQIFQKLELVEFSSDIVCGSGECLDPNGTCAVEVQCFVDPCDVTSCGENESCTANYCGGCNAVCTPVGDSTATTTSGPTTTILTSVATTNSSLDVICPEGECLDPNGTCAIEVQCFADPCQVSSSCSDNEICIGNTCGGCHAVCVPSGSVTSTTSSTIFLDTTTLGSVSDILLDTTTSTVAIGTEVTSTIGTDSVPIDSDLCEQIRVVFNSSALSRFLVPDGKSGTNMTIVTSADVMSELLAGFYPTSSDASTTGLENIDFTTEQVIFGTYYQSSTCNAELESAEVTCVGTTVEVSMTVLDDSIGCETACDAEGQVVYALVTPIGADASFDTTVVGPCLDSPTTDSITLATTVASASITSVTAAVTTTTSSSTVQSSAASVSPTTKPSSAGNIPEANPNAVNSSNSLTPKLPFILLSSALVLFHLSWRL